VDETVRLQWREGETKEFISRGKPVFVERMYWAKAWRRGVWNHSRLSGPREVTSFQ